MRLVPYLAYAVVIVACGGADVFVGNPEGGTGNDGQSQGDSSGNGDAGNSDGATTDGATSDGGSCMALSTTCDANGCPKGTVCLQKSVGATLTDVGCVAIQSGCTNGVATCDCMKQCFCPAGGVNQCYPSQKGLICSNGAVSRREFKKDITYVGDQERQELASLALSIPLATYRYKTEPNGDKKHLGFIIDDQADPSPAVQSDRTHVDEYGYTSMLLATVQEQQKQIDALSKKVDALQKQCK